jgi:hypothetical protein
MKMSEAEDIISGKNLRSGYVVCFEVRAHGVLKSDHFPDVRAGEVGIATEDLAWELAGKFARAQHTDPVVNVFVRRAADFSPVTDYQSRKLNRYP